MGHYDNDWYLELVLDVDVINFPDIWQGETLVHILERGITLIHPYSRNKSD